MKREFDIVLIEKPIEEGLTRTNCMDMFDMLKGIEAYPIEIENPCGISLAMGFIGQAAADRINYDYKDLFDYLKSILADMELESEDDCYEFQNLDIYLGR